MIGLDLIIGFSLIESDGFEFGPDKVDSFETAFGLGLLFLIADAGEEFCPNAGARLRILVALSPRASKVDLLLIS